MQSISGTSISQNVVIAMSGIAKVYAGELVETGETLIYIAPAPIAGAGAI